MRRRSQWGDAPRPTRAALLLVATTLAFQACGGGSGSSGPSTTLVGGAPLRLPDDKAIQQAFGPDAKIARSDPLRGGAIDRACGLGNLSLRTRNALSVEGRAGNAAVTVNVVLLEFPTPGVASSFFTSFARGEPDCEWTDINKEKRALAQAVPLDDVAGARVIEITVLHDTGSGASSINTVVLRNATVANLAATPTNLSADVLSRMTTLLTR
jgi:hypothetical protein